MTQVKSSLAEPLTSDVVLHKLNTRLNKQILANLKPDLTQHPRPTLHTPISTSIAGRKGGLGFDIKFNGVQLAAQEACIYHLLFVYLLFTYYIVL